MDQYNSKEVKESIFLVESRAQKEIRKIASDASIDISDISSHQQANGVSRDRVMEQLHRSEG